MKQKKIALTTLGCKVNQCDSVMIEESLLARGFQIVDFRSRADIYIVNTCSVTHKTDSQSRQLIRRAKKHNPRARIIVTGCYAQVTPETLARMEEVSLVVGNAQKHKIADCIAQDPEKLSSAVLVSDINQETRFKDPPLRSFSNHTRAFLKIQDGCESFCSYCIVPYARGKSRSLPAEETLKRLSRFGTSGFKEIVLTGINLGAYGADLSPRSSLLKLLEQIDYQKPVPRVRLSSLEPMDVTCALIDFLSTAKTICPHLHLSLQSGDDAILKRMNRTCRSGDFKKLVSLLFEKIPHLCLGVDVIAGFPGETEEQFCNTHKLLKELPISYLHVFPYSKRDKTKAAAFPDHLPQDVIKRRCAILRELGNFKKISFYSSYYKNKVNVLLENKLDGPTDILTGHSRNYIPVLIEGTDSCLLNQEREVEITRISGGRVWGKILKCTTVDDGAN